MLTLLSSPSTLLSLTSSLHSAATNASWTVLGCESLVTLTHGVGMGYLQSRVAPVKSLLKSCLKPASRGPYNGRRTGSRFTRFCNFLRRKAASSKSAEGKMVSAMKGARAASRAREAQLGRWLPSCLAVKRVTFKDRIQIKEFSRCDMSVWDRAFDLAAKSYAGPLRLVHFGGVQMGSVNCWIEPDGHNQLHFPRTRFIRDGPDPEMVDDDGDIDMDLS
ncbi:MAG: hypothetical protein Q9195_008581 [Heterodermia aff. obscurata]